MKKLITTFIISTAVLIADIVYATAGPPGPETPHMPEPVSSTLFVIGGAILGYRYFRKK